MKMIQEWLGHSDFSTTANIYLHLDYASKVSSAEAMLNGLGMGSNPENAPKKVWFLSRTGRFLSCYEIVKLKNSAFCIKKRYRAPKKARCTVDWRSIRDLNSGGATNALSHFECDPFDLLGNAPYSNPPKSSPEKGEKSRREQQIFSCRKQRVFDDESLENQW